MLTIAVYMAASVFVLLQCGKKNKKGAQPKSEVPKSGIDATETAPPPAPDAAPE